MANQTGIAIVIKAFLPTGKTLDEQFEALSIVKNAHAAGDYSELLKAATVEEVKTEQKTRRIEEAAPAAPEPAPAQAAPDAPEPEQPAASTDEDPVPDFLKKPKKAAA